MQAASDIFLGYSQLKTPQQQDFYVRQLRDMKYSVDLNQMNSDDFYDYISSCGTALAHAHAKAGNADMIMGYLGKSQRIIQILQDYAVQIAERNQHDYLQFMNEIHTGKIDVSALDV